MSRIHSIGSPSHLDNLGMISLPTDLLDIAGRIQKGDELWRGDPDMELVFNGVTCKFEVLALDEKRQYYVAGSWDRCDQNILVDLARGDWQRGRARRDEMKARNDSVVADQRRAAQDARHERIDRAHHALTKALGHHTGGTHRIFSMHGRLS